MKMMMMMMMMKMMGLVGVVPRTGGSSSGLAGRAELLGRLTGPILHFLGPYEWA
ncbi:hypothetical protein F2Q69_00048824 [Brassica cretica]|uniref:Secreted protein n=1 Tax=Brassica cretica TaxID=69181 RepID=A0A8S9PY37_BRACR|nr:hypothetical protein F2Q69_00048824 [Brassica cretica]